jgi:hypothetical protein
LANSGPDKRPGSDRRDCSFLGSAAQSDWLAASVASGLVIGTFAPIGIALTGPLEDRFAFSPSDPQAPPEGIILLGGSGIDALRAMSALSQDYPKARLIFSGFSPTDPDLQLKIFAQLGGDDQSINAKVEIEPSVMVARIHIRENRIQASNFGEHSAVRIGYPGVLPVSHAGLPRC